MTAANDNELIYHAQAGDEQAFAELIRAYNAYVYAIVIGIVNNPYDAEEVVQDIFVNVYRGLAQYEERKKFKSWVAEIARNCARNRLRKQQIETVPIDQMNEQSAGTEALPDEQLIRSEQRIDAIPEGMSKAELADEALQMMPEIMQGMVGMMQEMYSGAEIVSSEYVGDEFHFRISVPMPKIEMPQLPATMKIEMPEMPELPESIEQLVKMQKVDGAWRIYDTGGK